MSAVGGTRLGQPGTQVNLLPGAPALPESLTGRSWIVADAGSGEVLAAHNAHWRLPPASTMKMLFADTVLPTLPKDQVHKVTEEEMSDVGQGSSLVGVKEDYEYSVHDLWLGVFLRSGNDAVHVLSAMNGGIEKTVKDMQAHAEELQALDTHVVSPDGYDAPEQVSSAYDLTLIARSGLQKQDFKEYCGTVSAQFPGSQEAGKARDSFEIQNTNRLMTGAGGLAPYKGIAGGEERQHHDGRLHLHRRGPARRQDAAGHGDEPELRRPELRLRGDRRPPRLGLRGGGQGEAGG
ncbi:hypothetical protein GCM10020254_35540 [Streptomyces goshikiensis]